MYRRGRLTLALFLSCWSQAIMMDEQKQREVPQEVLPQLPTGFYV